MDSRTGEDVRVRLQRATRDILSRSSSEAATTGDTPAVARRTTSEAPSGRSRPEPTPHDSALRLLAVRARSRSELRTRLLAKEFDPAEVDAALDRLATAGLVDDVDFATQWVRARSEYSGRGRTALRHELRTKGVEPAIVESALSEIDDDDERTRAAELVAKKAAHLTADMVADPSDRDRHTRRLVSMLARRGYSPSIAFDLAREALADLR